MAVMWGIEAGAEEGAEAINEWRSTIIHCRGICQYFSLSVIIPLFFFPAETDPESDK